MEVVHVIQSTKTISILATKQLAKYLAALAAIKYAFRARKDHKKLLNRVGGDKEQLKRLKANMNEPDEETKAANLLAFNTKLEQVKSICASTGFLNAEQIEEASVQMQESYSDGHSAVEPSDYVAYFIEDNTVDIWSEGFDEEDAHAELVNEMAEATNGKWVISDAKSTYDEASKKWVVKFTENSERKTWRFSQSGDELSQKFLRQLVAYAESRSGYVAWADSEDDNVEIVFLPNELYQALLGEEAQQQSA